MFYICLSSGFRNEFLWTTGSVADTTFGEMSGVLRPLDAWQPRPRWPGPVWLPRHGLGGALDLAAAGAHTGGIAGPC